MTKSRRWMKLGAAASLAALGACAPVTFAGGGMGSGVALGITPRGHVSLGMASCMLTGMQSPLMGLRANAAAMAGSLRQEVAAIQAQLSFHDNSVPARMNRAKRLASGGC